ncbi:MAG: cell shape determination protein CcmA [Moraxellaceae bacterium]|nr:MAG: cell shape determination protein CcmA [Moraxellaceae bacterium]
MWGKDNSKKVDFDRHAGKTTMISKGTEITGDITFDGGLLIEGVVRGNIRAAEGSDALLRLSEAGIIEGCIYAPNVVINGKVVGDVFSPEHVELASKAVVNGNVHYNLIEMVMGSEVNGSLVHDQLANAISKSGAAASTSDTAVSQKNKAKANDTHKVTVSVEKSS